MADRENEDSKSQKKSITSSSKSSYKKSLIEKKKHLDEIQNILDLKEKNAREKLRILDEMSAIDSGTSGSSSADSQELGKYCRTKQWVEHHDEKGPSVKILAVSKPSAQLPSPTAPPPSATENQCFPAIHTDGATVPLSTLPTEQNVKSDSSDVNKLAVALQNTIKSAFSYRDSNLPTFDGSTKDWLQFKASFVETTEKYNIQPAENLRRLRLALKGEAKSAVSALLHACSDPERIINALELRFGQAQLIVREQIKVIKKMNTPKNIRELSVFASEVMNCEAVIKSLKLNEFLHDNELYEQIVLKMCYRLRDKWAEYAEKNINKHEGALSCVAEFLQCEAQLALKFIPEVEPTTQSTGGRPRASEDNHLRPRFPVHNTFSKGQSICALCKDSTHSINNCEKFSNMSVDDRYMWAKSNRKCFRCLQYSHPAKNCKISKYLHKLLRKVKQGEAGGDAEGPDSVLNVNCEGAMLKVVPVVVHSPGGPIKTFILLDEGATISLVDESLARQLGSGGRGPLENLNIEGIGSSRHLVKSSRITLKIESTLGEQFLVNVRSMPNLNLKSQYMDKDRLLSYNHIKQNENLVDWYKCGTPTILLGQDNWPLIITRKIYAGKANEPVISETLLGHVVHGNHYYGSPHKIQYIAHVSHSIDELHALVKDNFSLDALGIEPKQRANPLEDKAIQILQNTTKKLGNNRWETGLLWNSETGVSPSLPDSSKMALKRFGNLENKLLKNPQLAEQYKQQVDKLVDNSYAVLDDQQPQCASDKVWFLPHFPVLNPNKPGKVRLVFDAAARVQNVNLNDMLFKGPDLLQSLLGILWGFRLKPIAVSGDIKDMFLRIKIKTEDQQYQKFYWRTPGSPEPPQVYRLTSMLFGAKCSPCSAIFVLNENAKQHQDTYPDAVKAIQTRHYMDDYLDCFDSESEAVQRIQEVMYVHDQGGFEIVKWASNSAKVLESIPEEKKVQGGIQLLSDESAKEKTLGMIWKPATDTLSFNFSMNRVPVKVVAGEERPTKRQMLAAVMSVFDPIGLLSPFSIRGKMILQEVWRSGINWDEKLFDKEYEKWQSWISELRRIKDCQIPRCYRSRTDRAHTELHTFCDSSIKAYAAVCYLRFVYEDGEIKVVLVAAKARVTALKPSSIPRLELQAALLGARLAHAVVKEHKLEIKERYFWSDSSTTLAWIRSDPRNYKAFVGHRLAAIDELSMVSQWRWVPTAQNSADIATRDTSPLDLSQSGLWFSGPEFLKKNTEACPVEKNKLVPAPEASCEKRVYAIRKKEYALPDIAAFSSWKRLIYATANVFLFINKCRKSGDQKLTLQLLEKAEKTWIKKMQEDSYTKELAYLENKEELPNDSPIFQLTPVLDDEGIMRLQGRIDRAQSVSLDMKRPIILNGSHQYTKLLIYHYHKKQNHSSTETVVNEIRQKYWLVKMRSTIRSVAHNCQFCKILKAKAIQPPMGDLPQARLQHHQRPFSHCGLDYFGPVEVSIGRRREKRWGALFTCMVTRAVHMEIAGSLTSDSVIMAIRRLTARFGSPTTIYSDNGTNFKGADGELKKAWLELDKEAISKDMLNRGVEWHYNAPTAAHMGGAWERLVQSIKKALSVTLHERAPREEVLATLLAEAELTVNSRPLTFVSVDPRDPEALTPNHFLIGSSSAAPIPGKFDDKDLMLKKQWKISQRLADMFWSRWLKEYLPTMVDRKMKGTANQDIKKDSLVLIADSALPRNMWPRGIVTQVFPGKDNKVRVVEIKTVGGIFRRPVNKIVLLPTDSSDDEHEVSVNYLSSGLSRLEQVSGRARGGGTDNSLCAALKDKNEVT